MRRIQDPEVEILASYSQIFKTEYQETIRASWDGSPFSWIKTGPSSRQVGAIGEKLVSGYFAAKGFDVTSSPDGEADRIIAGQRAEIKLSTLWNTGSYKFQQLRDQNYAFAICLGISPFDAHCWVLPKNIIMERWASGDIRSQHGGREGNDTAWLTVRPNRVPAWLDEWGGRLSDATEVITQITGQTPSP